ncbi:uncharacterized protein B0H18DRAFT_926431 [Fomitopsis serialis]|uniref:uncharacterized protein n=1 Tax=Fomitopsis serialis TaxID=139415 RepID=UPI0020089F6C|nr:uncharacterized protein B0H18DRAFT_926431 [Neoantrodia serialis]KAH9936384.1 hypothetical protein B0H18DRAFT_926431 [Neoantrodia serialis]
MDAADHRARPDQLVHDDGPYGQVMDEQAGLRASRPSTAAGDPDGDLPGYTLMVAGRRTGKTSFLRLLLDTSPLSPAVSRDQLTSVAKFVQGCSGHTSHVRAVSANVDLAPAEGEDSHEFTLTLIDTPSLDFVDDAASQRVVTDILRHVDARFAESIDDERKAQNGDHHVHLCIYFLDPDTIVPPSVSAPPVPLVTRSRAGSMSDIDPVILEPPVTTNPLLCRPALPPADIATIRRLSTRVNVLPVVGRADILTNERLAAVKTAVRRDLAEAGIGFGIFDLDTFPQYPQYSRRDSSENVLPKLENANGYGGHTNGASSSATSSPSTSMSSPSYLRLPYAVISPDIYSHSDGVARPAPSRTELAHQYTPLQHFPNHRQQTFAKIVPGKFIRSYRWGFLDVMDTTHCDFVQLRGAIFHHMQTLQKYTREYLFQKFRAETQPPLPHPIPTRAPHAPVAMPPRLPALSHASRPILAIDTTPSHAATKGQPHPARPATISLNGDAASRSAGSPQPRVPSGVPSEGSPGTTNSSSQSSFLSARGRETSCRRIWPLRSSKGILGCYADHSYLHIGSQRLRTKKITVACNFCRSRKLKCDGGRPACSQCFKRSNPCDYTASQNRRGGRKARKQFGGSESEGESIEDQSMDMENASQSPEVSVASHPQSQSQPTSRRNSNVSMLLGETLPPLSSIERRDESAGSTTLPPIQQATTSLRNVTLTDARPELPPIATLSAPPSSASKSLPLEDPPSIGSLKSEDGQMTARRRTSAAATGKTRATNHGSKIVACNVCRARKTRCDGAHPACGSCSRRSLPCNYVNDPGTSRGRGRAAAATPGPSGSTSSRSSPSVPVQFGASNGTTRSIGMVDGGPSDSGHPVKKMRMATESAPRRRWR